MADKHPMPVPGDKMAAEEEGARGTAARTGGGESGGGAYPNPHSGKTETQSGPMGHGGQTEIGYHGPEQLGDEKLGGDANAAASKG